MIPRLYTIKEVSIRTRITTQLIRKWEERYEAVLPERMPNGYRGYTKGDIDTLLWLKGQVDDGVPIGMAVLELKNEQEAAASELGLEQQDIGVEHLVMKPKKLCIPPAMDWSQRIEQLLQCFISLDLGNAQLLYEQLLATNLPDDVMLHILQPTLVELGERWERGEISEYQEHFGSHFIRDKILAIHSMFRPNDNSPMLVTACGPGERHELGILMFGFFAKQEGFQVIYLGSSPSEKGIFDCLGDVQPAAFTFSYSMEEQLEASMPFLLELDREITACQYKTKVFIGGRAIHKDGLLQGTEQVFLMTGDAKSCIEKINAVLQATGIEKKTKRV